MAVTCQLTCSILFLLVRASVAHSEHDDYHDHDHHHHHHHHHEHVHDHVHAGEHVHGHVHDTEPPYYKYSRAANEKEIIHDDHNEYHGHSHDYHDKHDHTHEHDHGHSHRHTNERHHPTHDNDLHYQRIIVERQKTFRYEPYDPNGMFWLLNNYRTRLWVYSIGSTLLISFAPFIILSLIPVQANTAENEPMLKVLLSFGSGGLLGDAFLHLIPHAQPSTNQHGHAHTHSHSHSHSHSYGVDSGHSHGSHDMSVGGYVLAGIITFLTVEKLVRILRSNHLIHAHSHSHSHSHRHTDSSLKTKKTDESSQKKRADSDKDKKSDVSSAEESSHNQSDDDEDKYLLEKATEPETGFKVAAYLNMAADFAHNFTDGLAIGASYLAGTTVGVVTMLTVLVHEVPHEIGDFAILVQSGFSKKKAMFVQLLTAIGALTGCMLSLCATNADELSQAASSSWILPFTAGGFIYIATVSVIPELLENSSIWQSIKEVAALLIGIILMYLIAVYE